MRLDRDRPDARPAAAVGDAERLVQVEVRHVGAELARLGRGHHGVEVRAVEVHLPAVRMDDVADVDDAIFEHTVRRRVGHHERREVGCMFVGLGAKVAQVDVAVGVARHDHHAHAGHGRARRVGAMGRRRDEAHVATRLAVRAMERTYREQPGELAL